MLSLSKAVEYPGDPAHVAAALAGGGCDPCGRDAFGLTALHKFSAWDKVDLITLLLPHLDDADARLNERAGEHGWTPLHAAAEMGAARAAEALLALPAVRPDVTDRSGRTAEQLAEASGTSGALAPLFAARRAV